MDILEYLPECRVLICRKCRTAIFPQKLLLHLQKYHIGHHPALATATLTRNFVVDTLPKILVAPLIDPSKESLLLPPLDCEAFTNLEVHQGYGCTYCAFVSKAESSIRQHYNVQHAPIRRGRGGAKQSSSKVIRDHFEQQHFGGQAAWSNVSFQRFFSSGSGSTNFRVRPLSTGEVSVHATEHVHATVCAGSGQIADRVERTLAELEQRNTKDVYKAQNTSTKTQVSPWLERTGWARYLDGQSFVQAAQLARLPEAREPLLCELAASVDRLVEAAYISVCNEQINLFAQRRISSFLSQRKAYARPILVKLQKATYKRYKNLWKRLLCFAYRSSEPSQAVRLLHQLNSRQTALLDQLLALAAESATRVAAAGWTTPSTDALTDRLDNVCLEFSIAILDHVLHRDIFESVALRFLAVLGIDVGNSTFHEAINYTSYLSGFIKISQLLVLQKAIREEELHGEEDILGLIDRMRERFMTTDTCTPLSWAVSMRSFGKKISESTTAHGYIRWSDDQSTVFYKDVELEVGALRMFVADQVLQAQSLLEKLLLLSAEEVREDIVPAIPLRQIRDNPTITTRGWNFLLDERNKDMLPSKKGWLLRRIMHHDRLQEEFVSLDKRNRIVWDATAVRTYRARVTEFLESLLLLVHITAGQPARGTEITGLLHSNTTFHRNNFVEDGLVALVTSYHKGYTCTGSTKIIHRYLPKEISELVVYYLWIIIPFVGELDLLVPATKSHGSAPFLWPEGEGSWSSQRLSTILRRETASSLKTPLTISTYRHIAIALSRRHLLGGGFKRDYDILERANDQQAAHTSWTAGRLYARGLEEAPGHVEARRAEFRAVSRRWHAFLGFATPTVQKRPLAEIDANLTTAKRARCENEAGAGKTSKTHSGWEP